MQQVTKIIWYEAKSFPFYSPVGDDLQLHILVGGLTLKSPIPLGAGQRPRVTQCVLGPYKCVCQMASKSVERFKQGARV